MTLAFMPQAIRGYFGDGETWASASTTRSRSSRSARRAPCGWPAGSSTTRSSSSRATRSATSTSTSLVAAHKEKGAAVTIGLKSVENPLEFGIVVTDEDGRVERFLEKPSWGQVFSDTINTGIYVIEPEALTHVPADRPYDFSKELFPLLLEMGRPIYGHVLDGYWQDIGNLDQFRQANFDALDGRVRARDPRHQAARERLDRRRCRARRRRPRRRPGLRRQQLPDRAETRPSAGLHRALQRRHPA